MSIIIHELNLPIHYDMTIRITPGGEVYDEDLGGSFAKAEQLPPHGRLIDVDAMSERLHKLIVNFYSAYEKDGKDERLASLLEIDLGMRKVIYAAPTIIEAEGEE